MDPNAPCPHCQSLHVAFNLYVQTKNGDQQFRRVMELEAFKAVCEASGIDWSDVDFEESKFGIEILEHAEDCV